MNRRKISVKFTDQKGNLVNFTFEGALDLPTFLKYLTSLGFFSNEEEINDVSDIENIFDNNENHLKISPPNSLKIMKNSFSEEIRLIIESLSGAWFTSKDIKRIYEARFNKQIPLSKVSTYLARLYDKGFLSRLKSGKSFRYRIEMTAEEKLNP